MPPHQPQHTGMLSGLHPNFELRTDISISFLPEMHHVIIPSRMLRCLLGSESVLPGNILDYFGPSKRSLSIYRAYVMAGGRRLNVAPLNLVQP